MIQVDYYIFDTAPLAQRDLFACRLTQQVLHQGLTVYLHTADADHAGQLDDLLWGFQPHSFVPHGLAGQNDDSQPALIGWQDAPPPADVLINLSTTIPDFHNRFPRVAEIIVNHPSIRDPGRENYRIYKQQGYVVRNHRLDAGSKTSNA